MYALRTFAAMCREISVVGTRCVIIAPHPDDEVLGCGGLIARLISNGIYPDIIIMSGGGASHQSCCGVEASQTDIIAHRHSLALNAADVLGLPHKNIHFLNYPDGGICWDHSETKRLSSELMELRPDAVFIPCYGEGWSDHLRTTEIVKRIVPDEIIVWSYCVWMWYYNFWRLDWTNAYRLKMTKSELGIKRKAMDAYLKPMAPCGNPWSGVLPNLFMKAHYGRYELFFKER